MNGCLLLFLHEAAFFIIYIDFTNIDIYNNKCMCLWLKVDASRRRNDPRKKYKVL